MARIQCSRLPILQHLFLCFFLLPVLASAQKPVVMEKLDRGVVAINQGEGKAFLSWRLLGTEPDDVKFRVYQSADGGEAKELTSGAQEATCLELTGLQPGVEYAWHVRAVVDGQLQEPSKPFIMAKDAPAQPYLSIPITAPVVEPQATPEPTPEAEDGRGRGRGRGGPVRYSAGDASVGDLDGDGQYEIVVKWDPSNARDSSQGGMTGNVFLDAYTLAGRQLWRIDLGRNIRAGAHYTQFVVYDLDGDGRAEVACKTADGTVDGQGKVIGDPDVNHRNEQGHILRGPEFLTIFDGLTGAALATTQYIPTRYPGVENPTTAQLTEVWGDGNGNRSERFNATVAYLDGEKPSLVFCRGYYTGRGGLRGRTCLAAWNWRDGQLNNIWTFDTWGHPELDAYNGQGNHQLSVADVDQDGRQEIVYGACVIDDDGSGLYSTGLGHGDALHVSDMDPQRPGLEIFDIHENPQHNSGIEFRDARTGENIWKALPRVDVGRGAAFDIDPRHLGYEMWSAGGSNLRDVKGNVISEQTPRSINMGIWWDGDLLREILDGVDITKWNWETGRQDPVLSGRDYGAVRNNGTKANPCLSADILGDWREEMIARNEDSSQLMIFSTTIPTQHRFVTLMHDPQYRVAISWQNSSYNQPPHPGFYLGEGMQEAKKSKITYPK